MAEDADHQTVCEGVFPSGCGVPQGAELFLLPGSGKQQMGYLQGAMEVVWGKDLLSEKWARGPRGQGVHVCGSCYNKGQIA